jgi:hypothetical protein
MRFPTGSAASAKAVAEPRFPINEIAASLAATQLQQGFTTGEMGFQGSSSGQHLEAAHVFKGAFSEISRDQQQVRFGLTSGRMSDIT